MTESVCVQVTPHTASLWATIARSAVQDSFLGRVTYVQSSREHAENRQAIFPMGDRWSEYSSSYHPQ